MKKTIKLMAIIFALVLMVGVLVSPTVCYAEEEVVEQQEQTGEKLDADKVADIVIEKLHEQEKTKNLAEWIKKYKAEILTVISGIIGLASAAIAAAVKAKVTQNINNQEGVFKRTSDAIIANEKAVDKLNGYAEQFDRIDGEIAALVGAVNERDEAQAKQQAELKAILIACVNMLHTAYAHSNLTEETKSVIEGFFGDAIHYNQKMADMKISLESLVEKFNELKTKVEDAKKQSEDIKVEQPKKPTEWEG